MGYKVSWGPNAGMVSIVSASAADALSVVRAFEEEGRTDLAISDPAGALLTIAELEARAAAAPSQAPSPAG